MTEIELSVRREKARQLRYKKPICRGLNLEEILNRIYEIQEECSEIQFATDLTDIIEDVLGSEDEATEFKYMFSSLAYDCDRTIEELTEIGVSENFDDIFVATRTTNQTILGFDTYEEDYLPILPDWETQEAMKVSKNRLMRLTKSELIETMQLNFRVAFSYIGLQDRYNSLKATMDIIRGKNVGQIQVLKDIEALYEKSYATARRGTWDRDEYTEQFDGLLDSIDPYDRVWLE